MGRVVKSYTFHPVLQVLVILELAAVAAATVVYLPPAKDFADPTWAKMIVFHVPCAAMAVLAYVVSTVYAVAYLSGGRKPSDIKSEASAVLGFVFTVLATVTGMVFAAKQWGKAWNWDPRETSILMLLMVYTAYFALRAAIADGRAKAKISSVYNILACLVMPFFVFVLPRITPSLHPKRASLSPEYGVALAAATVGFVLLYLWALRAVIRAKEVRQK